MIVWNPAATVQFAVPGTLRSVSQHDIFGNATPVEGSSVSVGYAPVLLMGHQERWR
jgi:hypothetical protein